MAFWKLVIAIMIIGYVAGGVAGCRQESPGGSTGKEMSAPATDVTQGASEQSKKKPLKNPQQ